MSTFAPMAAAEPKYQYRPYQKTVTLLKDIKDIHAYVLILPDCPPLQTITNYGKPPSEQFFQRVKIPNSIKRLNFIPREEAIRIAAADPEISEFIAKMWYHFKYGDFQYINGEPFHISPTYWFYLNFWKLDDGYPQFRYDTTYYCTNLWEFAWWDYMVLPSPVCYGMIKGTKRRQGKTFEAMARAYKIIISGRHRRGGIQSKTDDDAAEAFEEKMVEPILEMPFFFKPFMSNPSMPKSSGYTFTPVSKKGKWDLDDMVDSEDYLFSRFTYYNSSEGACGSQKFFIHISDEDGKWEKGDVFRRHELIKPALRVNEMVVGKEIATTTVEEMSKGGGERFCYKWQMSDRDPNRPANERTVNDAGETDSGLWQWFCPTRATMVHDQYGLAIIETPDRYQQRWLRDVKHDPDWQIGGRERIKARIDRKKSQNEKYAEMRMYPEEVRDMFISGTDFCHFDREILEKRLKYFAFGYERTELADKMAFLNLHWKNNQFGGEVDFTHATTKEEAIFWFSYIPKPEQRNKHTINDDTGKKQPANWDRFSSGADPFKFDTDQVVDKKRMSFAAMTIFAEHDPTVDTGNIDPQFWVTGDMCGEACFRDDMSVAEMNEQYLMACIFFGMKLYPESNVGGVYEYFKLHGFEHYIEFDKKLANTGAGLYLKDKNVAGSYTDSFAIQAMFRLLQKYVKERGMRCKFYRTLRQIYELNPDNVKEKDLAVSLGKCLRVVMDFNPIRKPDAEVKDDIGDIVQGLGGRGVFNAINNPYGVDNFFH